MGDDNADGLTPQTPWKSFDKLEGLTLNPGDSILLARGSDFHQILEVSAAGSESRPIVIDAYGDGTRPLVAAPDSSLYAVCVRNSSYLILQNIEIVNKGTSRMAARTGVKISADNSGVSRDITLNSLYIHDVNGSLVKEEGGGSGLLVETRSDSVASRFDGLVIENCILRRCERNGMIWACDTWSRRRWGNPSTGVTVRHNLLEEIPGDGIVPIGCDGAVIEYNLMRNCTALLPDSEAAAGFWPWSCDNTVIRFNEVTGLSTPWDSQAYDSDYNCTNTLIEYNYSHLNDGGLILICNDGGLGPEDNAGNVGTVVRYNLSINDGVRERLTRVGTFSPGIHIAGPVRNTLIENNILYVGPKPSDKVDRCIITSDSWNGYADSTFIKGNVFFAAEPTTFRMTGSTANEFSDNIYIGSFSALPSDATGRRSSETFEKTVSGAETPAEAFGFLLREIPVAGGEATLSTVNPDAIRSFFKTL